MSGQQDLDFRPMMIAIRRRGHRGAEVDPFRHDDCQRQAQCLRAIVVSDWHAIGAECPRQCPGHAPTPGWLRAKRTADGLGSSVLSEAQEWAEDGYIGRNDDA